MWTLCLLLKKIKNKDKLKLFGILAPALKHRHTQKTGCNRQHQQILTFLKVFKGNLRPIPSTCLCLIHGVFTELTLLNISVTAVATLFQLSRDHSLPPTPSTTFHRYTSAYSFSSLLDNYPSSMRWLKKQRLLTHHTNYILLCHIHLHFNNLLPEYLLSTMCPTANNVSTLDYISPCLSPNHFKQLQWGFQLPQNRLFCEHNLSEYHPESTSCPNLKSTLTTKTNNDLKKNPTFHTSQKMSKKVTCKEPSSFEKE